jgi:hypothetical protein
VVTQLRGIQRTASCHERVCSINSDTCVSVFIVVNSVDSVWTLLVRGRGVGASDMSRGRKGRKVGGGGVRLNAWNLGKDRT